MCVCEEVVCEEVVCEEVVCEEVVCEQVVCEQVVWEEAAGGGRRSERGSAQPKTRPPHKDMGKN